MFQSTSAECTGLMNNETTTRRGKEWGSRAYSLYTGAMHLGTNTSTQNLMHEVALPEFSILSVIQIWTNYFKKNPNVLASQPACLLLCKVQREKCSRALWKPTYLFTDQWLSPETWSHASKLRFLNLDTQQYRSAVCGLYCECPKGGSLKLNTS